MSVEFKNPVEHQNDTMTYWIVDLNFRAKKMCQIHSYACTVSIHTIDKAQVSEDG